VSQLKLTPPVIEMISERFKALAEPARLQILSCLRRGEMTVTELVEETGLGQANVSKHLQSLFAAKFVDRRKDGLFTYYALADRDVFRLCDLMCGRIERELAGRRKAMSAT
jgi:DNA-binding transcriptional ArsR family regulator